MDPKIVCIAKFVTENPDSRVDFKKGKLHNKSGKLSLSVTFEDYQKSQEMLKYGVFLTEDNKVVTAQQLNFKTLLLKNGMDKKVPSDYRIKKYLGKQLDKVCFTDHRQSAVACALSDIFIYPNIEIKLGEVHFLPGKIQRVESIPGDLLMLLVWNQDTLECILWE